MLRILPYRVKIKQFMSFLSLPHYWNRWMEAGLTGWKSKINEMLLKLSLRWQYGGADYSTSTRSHWDEDMIASLQLYTVDWEWGSGLLSLTFHLWREIFFFFFLIPRPYLGLTENYCKDSLSMDGMPSWVTNLFSHSVVSVTLLKPVTSFQTL